MVNILVMDEIAKSPNKEHILDPHFPKGVHATFMDFLSHNLVESHASSRFHSARGKVPDLNSFGRLLQTSRKLGFLVWSTSTPNTRET
ncbi:hypothetical protein Pyn_18589 [Prunus yedoensis var. nudiflora]|uniref:Uncharacterized protein n=1 Tax=Prunus yedoensis var. nudiflora TaxID=2094558 RepID=A0A314XN11_PRUYE|nr:hypothetical protein Pyn_18589 [Prunus yedoensis var. nudiflora]